MKTQQSNTIIFGKTGYGNPDMATTWCWHENFKILAFLMRTLMLAAFLSFLTGTIMAQSIQTLYWDFNQSSNCNDNVLQQFPNNLNISGSFSIPGYACQTTTGVASGAGAFIPTATSGNAIRYFRPGNTTTSENIFIISGADLRFISGFRIYFQFNRNTASLSPSLAFDYSVNGTTYTTFDEQSLVGGVAQGDWHPFYYDLSGVTSLNGNNLSQVFFRVRFLSSSSASYQNNIDIDNFQVMGTYTGPLTMTPGSNISLPLYHTGSTQSFTVPNCVEQITVEAWGGGGRGSTRSTSGGGAGGGGGAYARSTFTSLTPGVSINYYVGAGSSSTSAGQDSWFNSNSILLAKGGNSAANNSNTRVGVQAGSIGQQTYSGGLSAAGSSGNYGGGGASSAGTNSNGNYTSNQTTQNGASVTGGGSGGNGGANNANGFPGQIPGGGGGGTSRSSGTITGGTGGSGMIRITYTLPNNPTLTLSNTSVAFCYSASAQNAVFTYNATTGCPDKYSIDFVSGINDITDADLTGGNITVNIPAGLASGTYNGTLTVKNSTYGFVSSAYNITVTVTQPTATVSDQSNISCFAGEDGTITITASGGSGSYQFSLDNGSTYVSGSNPYPFTGLAAGNYYPRVKDANGCESPECE